MTFKTWSKPFHGVQHLTVPEPYQITVEDYGTFTNLTVLNLHNKPFTCPLVQKQFDTAQDARAHGERWMANNFLGA